MHSLTGIFRSGGCGGFVNHLHKPHRTPVRLSAAARFSSAGTATLRPACSCCTAATPIYMSKNEPSGVLHTEIFCRHRCVTAGTAPTMLPSATACGRFTFHSAWIAGAAKIGKQISVTVFSAKHRHAAHACGQPEKYSAHSGEKEKKWSDTRGKPLFCPEK